MTTPIPASDAPVPDRRGFLVGRDDSGHWLAVEIHGLGGGFFVSQQAALRYAGDETDHRPGAVRSVATAIRLDWTQGPTPTGF